MKEHNLPQKIQFLCQKWQNFARKIWDILKKCSLGCYLILNFESNTNLKDFFQEVGYLRLQHFSHWVGFKRRSIIFVLAKIV
jgi:hypothetical protein